MKEHKDLDAWKKGMALVKKIYLLTRQFPEEEKFGLTSQMRRSAVSVPSNIAEGAARGSSADFIRFLYISLGSLAELETQLMLSNRLGYSDDSKLLQDVVPVRKMLLGLIRHLKS